ncbi:MAG: N-formylglutamate amidohydrolase [Deltaproteobacteria bacterium]|nr:N-formylglutamate amidohydrolase [Deltaproteobacteria bacterium]
MTPDTLQSLEGVVDVTVHHPAGAPRGWLLVEIPHGATRTADYRRVEAQLKGKLPDELIHFFYVNTDIGAPEAAEHVARSLCPDGFGVVVARCLLPRTFIDTNRVIDRAADGKLKAGLTPGIPGYVKDPADRALLEDLHARYHGVVEKAYALVCGELNGLALQLHSYAPRSVAIGATDENIVEALHAAYVPAVYAKWPERPVVDLISATEDGSFRCAPALVASLKANFHAAGIPAQENATYHLHPVTMGMAYAKAWPDRVLCVELSRGLLAEPFVPFGESPISQAAAAKLAAPMVTTARAALAGR